MFFQFVCIYLFFTGNAIQTLKAKDSIKLLTVRGTNFAACALSGSGVSAEKGVHCLVLSES